MRLFVVIALVVGCRKPTPVLPLPPLPDAAYAFYLDGKLAAFRGDWPAAVESLTEAARAAPDQPMIVVAVARALAKARRGRAAREALDRARTKWPRHAEVWLAAGDLLARTRKDEAIRAYRRAIELSPTDERGYLGLAKHEDAGPSEATLRQLVERVPDSVEGHYQLGQRLATRGELTAAQASLRAVLERDPDHIDARLALARALRRSGQLAGAIEQTRGAFDRSGQALDIAEELFWVLCEADDRIGAIDLLTLLDDERSDADALAQVARLHRGLGRLTSALAIATRIGTFDATAGTVLQAELELDRDPAGAAARLLEIPEESARFVEARRLAAEALLLLADPRGARTAIEPARARAPADVDLALVAARAHADLGDLPAARAIVNTLPKGRPASLVQARLAEHVGDIEGALAILEPLVQDHPDASAALNLAGYLLADRNRRLDVAERWLRRARVLQPGDPAILDSWGWLLFRKGQRRDAIRVLSQASRFAPNEPEILLHLATAWAADGAPRTAVTVLDRARSLRPAPRLRSRIEALRGTLRAPGATMAP